MRPVLLTLLLAALAAGAAAQAPAPTTRAADAYLLGNREVIIPAPAGYVESTSRSERIKEFFAKTEGPGSDFLASHHSAEDMERILRGEKFDFGIYTKVSIPKRLRATDITRKDFPRVVAGLRANSPRALDLKNPEFQAELKRLNQRLDEKLMRLDLSQPVSLGEFLNTADAFGMLILMNFKIKGVNGERERVMVGSVSLVWVRDRVLQVYTYKNFHTEQDADDLREFTKRWLAEIIRANA
ncbi:MAG: hypothetical protein JOZ96_21475 [Acidobacteria bacterium]|nr:hypothetical protein [Acidobacteriota bacterium]